MNTTFISILYESAISNAQPKQRKNLLFYVHCAVDFYCLFDFFFALPEIVAVHATSAHLSKHARVIH